MEDLLQVLRREYSGFGDDTEFMLRVRLKSLQNCREGFHRSGRRYSETDVRVEEALRCLLIEFLTEKRLKLQASKKATDARYAEQRTLLDKAASIARQQWQNGSTLLHHKMKQFLAEEYHDETGKHPFLSLPEKSLLQTVKRVAKEMNRTDLISGQKKS